MSNKFSKKIIETAKKSGIDMLNTQLFYIDDHNSNFWIFRILDKKIRDGYKYREILRSFQIDLKMHKNSEKATLRTFKEEINRFFAHYDTHFDTFEDYL